MGADGVVLVVVAARASNGQAEEAARRHVDAVVPFVGARHRGIGEVVVPGTAPKKAQPAEGPRALRLVQQVARELRLHEDVPGHVAVGWLGLPTAPPSYDTTIAHDTPSCS